MVREQLRSASNGEATCPMRRSKHIDIMHHVIREYIQDGELHLRLVGMADMKSDVFIKSLPRIKLVAVIGMVNHHRPRLGIKAGVSSRGRVLCFAFLPE